MAAHDHYRNSQHSYRVFHSSGNTSECIRVWRHNVPNDPANEQFSRLGLTYKSWVDPRVCAGNEENVRALDKGQLFKKFLMSGIDILLESGDTPKEFFDSHNIYRVARISACHL
jgi:hypothetical protein